MAKRTNKNQLLSFLEESGLWVVYIENSLCIKYLSSTIKDKLEINETLIDRPIFDTPLSSLLAGQKENFESSRNFEYEETSFFTNQKFYNVKVRPFQKEDGASGFYILINDVNEAKKNELFLEDSQTDAKIGAWILDLKTGQARWSREVYSIYEIPLDTPTNLVMGKASYPEKEQKRLEAYIDEAIKGRPFEDTFKFITANNDVKFVRVTGKAIKQAGEIVALRGSIQDITSIYLRNYTTKEALAASKTAVIDWHPLKNEMEVDENWSFIFEAEGQDSKTNWLNWMESLHPEDREEWEETSTMALSDLPNFDINIRIVTKSGEIKNIQCHFKIFRNTNGEPSRVIGTASDVTKIRRTETELKEQYRVLAQTSKLAQLGEITAGLGHEINNPLTIALGNHKVISKAIQNEFKDHFKDHEKYQSTQKALLNQYEALQRISKLVKNFKNFSHSRGQDQKVFDTAETIKETCELFKVLINQNGIYLVVEVEKGLTTRGNKERFNQVITNLLSNAIDALEGQEKRYIVLSGQLRDNTILLSVKDNGEGIPEENREKIFDQFFTTKEVGKGTGIGLALCRSIIQQMGGSLDLDENHKEGALFSIKLPYVTTSALTDGPQELLTSFQRDHLNNLKGALIGQDDSLNTLYKNQISELGPSLTLYSSPEEFLTNIETKEIPFDFVISDMNMSEMTGLELLNTLKQDYGFTKDRLFVISGGMPNFLERKIKNVAHTILVKPLDLNQVALSLAEVPRRAPISLTPDQIKKELLQFCEYVGPKIKTCFTVVEFSENAQKTVYVNNAFTQETDYTFEEVKGKNLNLLQGEKSESEAIDYMRKKFKGKETFVVDILNYKKSGAAFRNRLVLIPLVFRDITFYFGLQTNLDAYTNDGQCVLHDNIQVSINLPITKTIQELLSCFYNGQLKGELLNEMATTLLEEVENIRHYILKL